MIHSKEQVEEILSNLYQQLGGHQFVVMTGSKFIWHSENKEGNLVQLIKMTKNASLANRLYITYNEGADLYSMRFTKASVSRKTFDCIEKEVCQRDNVYCNELQAVFTEVTNLYTHL